MYPVIGIIWVLGITRWYNIIIVSYGLRGGGGGDNNNDITIQYCRPSTVSFWNYIII